MNFAEKIKGLRQKMQLSQEALAEAVGVSRQAVSKWESGQSYPDLNKLLLLSDLFQVSLDELVRDSVITGEKQEMKKDEKLFFHHYEYKSERTIFGVPLVHINIGRGRNYRAKGMIAIGNIAVGAVAVGGIASGLISFGGLAVGLVSLGGVSLGLLLALGGLAAGILAIGGFALGIFAVGGLAVGMFSLGGCAVATHLAVGDYARGRIAVGNRVYGARTIVAHSHFLNTVSADAVRKLLLEEYPGLWKPAVDFILLIFQ